MGQWPRNEMPLIKRYALVLALVAALAGLYAWRRDLPGLYRTYKEREAQVELLRREVIKMRHQEEIYRQSVDRLYGDPVELEAWMRRDKNLVRPGEKIYRIEPALPEHDTGLPPLAPGPGLEEQGERY